MRVMGHNKRAAFLDTKYTSNRFDEKPKFNYSPKNSKLY